jgi:hypothetical protein
MPSGVDRRWGTALKRSSSGRPFCRSTPPFDWKFGCFPFKDEGNDQFQTASAAPTGNELRAEVTRWIDSLGFNNLVAQGWGLPIHDKPAWTHPRRIAAASETAGSRERVTTGAAITRQGRPDARQARVKSQYRETRDGFAELAGPDDGTQQGRRRLAVASAAARRQ